MVTVEAPAGSAIVASRLDRRAERKDRDGIDAAGGGEIVGERRRRGKDDRREAEGKRLHGGILPSLAPHPGQDG